MSIYILLGGPSPPPRIASAPRSASFICSDHVRVEQEHRLEGVLPEQGLQAGVSIYILLGGPSPPNPDFDPAPMMHSPPPPIFMPFARRP